ncbi:hypothetical protein ACMD2_16933 [Ananas comosus]|uniref:Uncharacterized protein n=1 Tax=Ananas comosus TaxID=4615 RepID=A0A199UWI8_ANACO|nr:hypothetical protein ACMD2_16933 [Ananas comosus]
MALTDFMFDSWFLRKVDAISAPFCVKTCGQGLFCERNMMKRDWNANFESWRTLEQLFPLNNGRDIIDEVLNRHLVKKKKTTMSHGGGDDDDDDDDEELALRRRPRLTSTRHEALALYRDSLRATRFFA